MQKQMSRPDQVLEMRLSSGMEEAEQDIFEEVASLSDFEAEHEVTQQGYLDPRNELINKEKMIESLKIELVKAKEFQLKLAEKDIVMDEMRKELMASKMRVDELEAELEKKNESEKKLLESLFSQTKHLEQTKMCLEESKLEIDFLNSNGESKTKALPPILDGSKAFDGLKSDVEVLKKDLAKAVESERQALLRADSLAHEVSLLKNELKLATEAEEKSSRAMDDLASVLKEVTVELNKVKEELSEAESELELMRSGVSHKEEKLKVLLEEARKEANQYKNTAERLRHEGEETLIACNEKEAGFISYIKRVEEERASAQKENKRLLESLLESEKMTRTSKDETHKLRDILKQALNEANAAKEAAGIAKRENSQLKDCLVEKDRALEFLTQEYEILKQRDIAAQESVRALKRLLQRSSLPKDSSRHKEEVHKEQQNLSTSTASDQDWDHDHDLTIPKQPKDTSSDWEDDHEPVKPKSATATTSGRGLDNELSLPKQVKVGKAMSFDLTELRMPKPVQ